MLHSRLCSSYVRGSQLAAQLDQYNGAPAIQGRGTQDLAAARGGHFRRSTLQTWPSFSPSSQARRYGLSPGSGVATVQSGGGSSHDGLPIQQNRGAGPARRPSQCRPLHDPEAGQKADKPANLRPLGILRPDANPQFAYLPGRGLSDALDRVVGHLREARQFMSRHELHQGVQLPAAFVTKLQKAMVATNRP